jgi:hypothetical protein
MHKLLPFALAVTCVTLLSSDARAREARIVPTAAFGFFMEFGDEAGIAGGWALWLGGCVYPSVEPKAQQTTGFLSFGAQLRTGMIPVLSGPTEVTPQLRAGLAFLGGRDFVERDSTFLNLTFPKARVYGTLGYRWAFAFGWDNMDSRRKDEQALRLGLGFQAPLINKAASKFPVPNGLELFVDVNRDKTLDRLGFDLTVGF